MQCKIKKTQRVSHRYQGSFLSNDHRLGQNFHNGMLWARTKMDSQLERSLSCVNSSTLGLDDYFYCCLIIKYERWSICLAFLTYWQEVLLLRFLIYVRVFSSFLIKNTWPPSGFSFFTVSALGENVSAICMTPAITLTWYKYLSIKALCGALWLVNNILQREQTNRHIDFPQ